MSVPERLALGWGEMSPSEPDIAVGRGPDDNTHGGRGQPQRHGHGRQPSTDATDASVIPPGQLGHGLMAVVRRQPSRPGNGRPDGVGGLFELICSDCGDNLYLDYSEVPARLQRLRGPRDIRSALAAYHRHIGLAT